VPEIPFSYSSRELIPVSPDGRSLLLIRNGGLAIRRLESTEEKEILPPGSLTVWFRKVWATCRRTKDASIISGKVPE